MENIKKRRRNQKMGSTLPMACSEGRNTSRRAQLLGEGGSSLPIITSSSRNKRKETTKPNKGRKSGAAEDIEAESQISTKAKISHGNTSKRAKSKRHKRNDKDRKSNRRLKRKNSAARRSAKELGIVWIGSFCPDGHPHYLVGKHNLDGGSLFKCKYCHKYVWLPSLINEAAKLGEAVTRYGAQAGYCVYLDEHQAAKVMIAKLQEIWHARQEVTDDGEMLELVTKIMEDKEYDRKDN